MASAWFEGRVFPVNTMRFDAIEGFDFQNLVPKWAVDSRLSPTLRIGGEILQVPVDAAEIFLFLVIDQALCICFVTAAIGVHSLG